MKKPQSTIDTVGTGPDKNGVCDLHICPRYDSFVCFTIGGLDKEDLLHIKSCINALLSCYAKPVARKRSFLTTARTVLAKSKGGAK